MLIGFLLGGYVVGAIMSFLIIGVMCCLGGRDSDMWKPFVYSAAWPIMLPLFLAGKAG